MEVSEETLLERYAGMDTDELIGLRQSNDLTDLAYTILDRVLSERGVTNSDREILTMQIEQESENIIPLASIGSRAVAQMIDAILALVLLIFPVIIFGKPADFGLSIGVLLYIAYLLFQDALPDGQSIGKRIMKIRVINRFTGRSCGLAASAIRNGLLIFLGFIDLLFLGSKLRQRLRDMLADTVVITADQKVG